MFPELPVEMPLTPAEDEAMSTFVLDLLTQTWGIRSPIETIYHYTDAIGFKGIIESGVLRATHVAYTNDHKEYFHAIELLSAAAAAMKAGARGDQAELLDAIIEGTRNFGTGSIYPYGVACFCTDPDKLAQWRAYGRGEGGIAIGVSVKALRKRTSSSRALLAPVVYSDADQREIANQLLAWALKQYPAAKQRRAPSEHAKFLQGWLTIFGFKASQFAPLFKHVGFKEENEWRLIHLFTSTIDVKFATRSTHLSPYAELRIGEPRTHPDWWPTDHPRRRDAMPDKLPIKEVWFGPGRFSPHNILSCRTMLQTYDYVGVDLHPSKVPFRDIA